MGSDKVTILRLTHDVYSFLQEEVISVASVYRFMKHTHVSKRIDRYDFLYFIVNTRLDTIFPVLIIPIYIAVININLFFFTERLVYYLKIFFENLCLFHLVLDSVSNRCLRKICSRSSLYTLKCLAGRYALFEERMLMMSSNVDTITSFLSYQFSEKAVFSFSSLLLSDCLIKSSKTSVLAILLALPILSVDERHGC